MKFFMGVLRVYNICVFLDASVLQEIWKIEGMTSSLSVLMGYSLT